MAVSVVFNGITYSVPSVAGESGWQTTLSSYLQALASGAATTSTVKQTVRVATTTPVTVQAATDYAIVCNLSSPGAVTVNLPAGATGRIFAIVDGRGDAGTNNITIDGNGAETINGAATHVIDENYGGVIVAWNGTQWNILASMVGSDPKFTSATVTGTATVGTLAATNATVGGANVTTVSNTQSFTNKTFDADGTGNSITNIENADIKTGAAIDRAKLASGSNSHVVINDGSGVMSSEAQLATSRGGTGVNSTATFPTSGTVVTRTATEALTNKTLDDTSNALLKGGNTTGTTVRVGSNDSNSVVIEANNTDVITARVASAANADVKIHGTAGVELPVGTVAQRPASPIAGTIRANSDSNEFEGYLNGAWQAVGGGINELPQKNYLKTWATGAVAPGTLSTVAATGNVGSSTAFFADATSGSGALTQSSSTALRGSFNYLSAVSGADTAGGRFFQTPTFALEGTDLGKPVSISFDVNSSIADGDWDVVVVRYNSSGTYQELIPVAGNASSSSATPSAKLPTGTTQFRGFFVAGATSGDLYALRFRRLSGSEQVRLDTLYVGPQTQLAGAPVTDWQSYTPTVSNLGTGGSGVNVGFWRRVGDTLEVRVQWQKDGSGGSGASLVTWTLPSGLTVDPTKARTVTSAVVSGGGFTYSVEASGQYHPAVPVVTTSVGLDRFWIADNGGSAGYTGTSFLAGSEISVQMVLPIANWSSNVTMAERAVEEYASNSNTADADNLSAFVNGPDGSLVPVTLSQNRTKRVRFQTPIQATDTLVPEIQDGNGRWITAFEAFSFFNGYPILSATFTTGGAATNSVGLGINGVTASSTDVDVIFGRYYFASLDGGTTQDWGGANTAGRRWRVRKVSGGAAVGYPVGARNVVGDTTGTAVPAGMLSESQSFTSRAVSAITANYVANASPLITLTPGRWLVFPNMTLASGVASVTGAAAGISTNTNNDSTGLLSGTTNVPYFSAFGNDQPMRVFVYDVATNTPIYAKAFAAGAAVTVTVTGFAVRVG